MNRDELLKAAEGYSKKARQWFRDGESALREKEQEIFSQAKLNVLGLKEAVTDLTTVVRDLRADQNQIQDQLRAAFASAPHVGGATATAQTCVKAAWLALQRSIQGWLRLKEFFPDQEDTVLALLVDLERMRRAVEKEALDVWPNRGSAPR